jgi:anti-sigma B factor antagonist
MSASNEGVRIDPQGRVVVGGDIDVVSAASIETALRQAEAQLADATDAVVIDVSGVRFIDSSGLRILLAASRRNERADRRVVLRSPGSSVERLLGITGTAAMFDLEYDRGDSATG